MDRFCRVAPLRHGGDGQVFAGGIRHQLNAGVLVGGKFADHGVERALTVGGKFGVVTVEDDLNGAVGRRRGRCRTLGAMATEEKRN